MAGTTFPAATLNSQQAVVASLGLSTALSSVTSAKSAYDTAVTAWVGAGSLESGTEYDDKVAALAALESARSSLSAARERKAGEVARTVVAYIDWQKAETPNDSIRFGEVAKQIALALLPNASPSELGL